MPVNVNIFNLPVIKLTSCITQGPKFVSDEEIERIKAKIEEDNRAIAALESKKAGKKYINILYHSTKKQMS